MSLAKLTKTEKRHKLFIKKLNKGHCYRLHGYKKDNKGILWTILCPELDTWDKMK